ncbi:hypothetical protein [Alicyclobacillus mengziensis]|uniref:Helix-turn-helix domain-containing protein n=1 Tax=Alicyclobacillus mengziensis TaxID=2931921 RepID=A0A9X7Z4L3_9BACL|nr:hypothetical protein [Alicyclobacillus mengziensis]QSO45467.1 hypothetical protein JZ786_12870 [Alicyclobacillus mengziensis]
MYDEKLMTFQQIGDALGIPWWDVKKILRSHDVPPISEATRARRRRQKDFEVIYQMHITEQMTFVQIGQALGRSAPYIRKVLEDNGVKPVNYGQIGRRR